MNWGNVKKIIIKILIIYYLLFLGQNFLIVITFIFENCRKPFLMFIIFLGIIFRLLAL